MTADATYRPFGFASSMRIRTIKHAMTVTAALPANISRKKHTKRYPSAMTWKEDGRKTEEERLLGNSSKKRKEIRKMTTVHRRLRSQKKNHLQVIRMLISETVNARSRFLFLPAKRDTLLRDFPFRHPLPSRLPAPGSNVRLNGTKAPPGPVLTANQPSPAVPQNASSPPSPAIPEGRSVVD